MKLFSTKQSRLVALPMTPKTTITAMLMMLMVFSSLVRLSEAQRGVWRRGGKWGVGLRNQPRSYIRPHRSPRYLHQLPDRHHRRDHQRLRLQRDGSFSYQDQMPTRQPARSGRLRANWRGHFFRLANSPPVVFRFGAPSSEGRPGSWVRFPSNRRPSPIRGAVGSHRFGFNGFAPQRNWWEGPNVCRSEEEKKKKKQNDRPNKAHSRGQEGAAGAASAMVTHHFQSSSTVCESSRTSYKCSTTVRGAEGDSTQVELYQCCHGYTREPQEFGCPQELQLADLPTTARGLGLNDFLNAVHDAGLHEELTSGNFTVFAPMDGALPLSSKSPLSSKPRPFRSPRYSRDQPKKSLRKSWRKPLLHIALPTSSRSSLSSESSPFFSSRPPRYSRDQPKKPLRQSWRKPLLDSTLPTSSKSSLSSESGRFFSSRSPRYSRDQPKKPLRQSWRKLLLHNEEEEEDEEEEEEEDKLGVLVLGHLLAGEPRRMTSFRDEDVLQTLSSPVGSSSTIRVNFYSRPRELTTANCVEVTSSDNLATNGVIHVVERALPAVTSSLVELVRGDKQFSYLKRALAGANMVSTLQNDGQFTLFAPTDSAFQRLDNALLDRLMSGHHPQCLDKVIKQHVLPNVICSGVIQELGKSRNLLNTYVNLTRTRDSKLFVNDAQIVRSDVMGTNGVMHVIDDVMIPDEALDLLSVAKKTGLTEFVKLTDAAGMTSLLRNASDVTVFVPSNAAIQALPAEVLQKLQSDPQLLQGVLRLHVVPGVMTCRRIYLNRRLDTLHPEAKVYINEYTSFPFGRQRVTTVQCAPITTRNVLSCNGLIHVIDRVLLPSPGNVVDVLAADSAYTTLVRLMKAAGLADSLQEDGPLTVFAPTNKAFDQLGKDTLKKLEENPERMASILKNHIFKGHLCCSGIFHDTWWHVQSIRALSGHALSLSRDHRGQPLVSSAVIGSCDNTATNGVVHGISSVLVPNRQRNSWNRFS